MFSCVFCSEVYVALQMLDKIAIVDSDNNIVLETIEIELPSSDDSSCMTYDAEISCGMADGCSWVDGMCMENSIDCMTYDAEMNCGMADGCSWMDGMCMEDTGGMVMANHTPHFIVIDEINKYWFTTTISSGYVNGFGMYNVAIKSSPRSSGCNPSTISS